MQHPYLPLTPADRRAMLAAVGAGTEEELFAIIPGALRLKRPLALPPHQSEQELAREFGRLAAANLDTGKVDSYLGAGAYEHYIPSVVRHLLGRSEFYTSYTPYQPEITQGMLQAIYEYQSTVCALTGMEVSNASLYEGGHALAESLLMACAVTGRKKAVLASGLHPEWVEVCRTYALPQGIEVVQAPQDPRRGTTDMAALESLVDGSTAAVAMASPNFFGCLEDGKAAGKLAHAKGALLVACVEPVSLGLLDPPSAWDADIACGEGQPLGIPLSFGGPWLGFIASRMSLVRRMPGRLCGITKDARGRRGFVLTLQTREQHIRREKATSNICTNQTLLALAATIYLSALGPQGLKEAGEACVQKAHYLKARLEALPGVSAAFEGAFFHEFTLNLPLDAAALCRTLQADGILAGVPLARFWKERKKELLVCVTETKTKAQLDRFAASFERALKTQRVEAGR